MLYFSIRFILSQFIASVYLVALISLQISRQYRGRIGGVPHQCHGELNNKKNAKWNAIISYVVTKYNVNILHLSIILFQSTLLA